MSSKHRLLLLLCAEAVFRASTAFVIGEADELAE